MFLQARVDKAKLQQDEQHQRQADLELLDNNTIVCSRLTTSTSSINKYFSPQPCTKPDTVLVNTLLTEIKYHEHIHNFFFFFWMYVSPIKNRNLLLIIVL